MSKKYFMLAITLIVVVLVATPLIAAVQALGKPNVGETFLLDPATDDPTIVGETILISTTEKLIGPDDTFRLGKDGYRSYEYKGVLGEGVMKVETITSLTKREYNEQGKQISAVGNGNYKVELMIEGDYGTGTLEGMCRIHWENVLVQPFRAEQWWTMSLHGKGDLNGLNVFAEAYATPKTPGNPYKQWWTTTTIMS